MQTDITKIGDQVVGMVKAFVQRAIDPLAARLAAIDQKLADPAFGARGEKGERGDRGDPGPRGERGVQGLTGRTGEKGERGEAGPRGERGERGADGAKGDSGIPGAPGPAGERGERGERGPQGLAGPRGERGEKGLPGEQGAVGPAGPAGPMGPQGPQGPQGERGEQGPPGAPGEAGRHGIDGKDGADGRDALALDIMASIDGDRSYPRGVYAKHAGGLVRSLRKTDPLAGRSLADAGWDVVVEGISSASLEQEDERNFILTLGLTGGAKSLLTIRTKQTIYRGIFRDTETYEEGDMVTRDGSVWHCNATTSEPPLPGSKAWTLAVKHGRDGKDGKPGAQGPMGAKGEPGRDLTQMSPDGRKW